MNQKITLRFADHVLTFKVCKEKVAEIRHTFRRKWVYTFTRADGNFLVNLNQVSWMKISPTDDTVAELGTEETAQEQVGEHRTLFGASTPSWPAGLPRGGTR